MSASRPPTRVRSAPRRRSRSAAQPASRLPELALRVGLGGLLIAALLAGWFHDQYTISLQSPILVRLQSPFVVAEKIDSASATAAQTDQQGHRLSAWQEYA